MNNRAACALQGLLRGIGLCSMPLAISITLLLFLQWPLRDLIGAWSTQANDVAQALFALYAAVAVSHATRRRAHLVARPDLAEAGEQAPPPRWRALGAALCVLPWALLLLFSATPPAWRALLALEGFPETFNPGYFVVKLGVPLLAFSLAAQALVDVHAALKRGAG